MDHVSRSLGVCSSTEHPRRRGRREEQLGELGKEQFAALKSMRDCPLREQQAFPVPPRQRSRKHRSSGYPCNYYES